MTDRNAVPRVRVVAYRRSAKWVSTRLAAGHLGLNTPTLYRLINNGQLPAYRFGRVIRLKAIDIEAFIESRKIEPGSLRHRHDDPGGARPNNPLGQHAGTP